MKTYLIYIAITLGIIAVFLLYAFEYEYFNRTFYMRKLAIIAVILGAGMGTAVAWRLKKHASDQLERVQLFMACIFTGIILLPLLASLSNRLLSFRAPERISVEFVEEKPYFGSRFGTSSDRSVEPTYYRSFVYRQDDLLKIQTKNALFPEASRGDTVQLPVKTGLWGFEYVPK